MSSNSKRKTAFIKEDFIKAVANNTCIADVLRELNRKGASLYPIVHKYVRLWNLDTSHWTGKPKNKPKKLKQLTNDELFIENSFSGTTTIKKRIIKDKLFKYECSRCTITLWQNEQLSLHLDHINGNPTDNRLENLRFLCPNCHSLTETYCGKKLLKPKNLICKCGGSKLNQSKNCNKCTPKKSKIDWPDDATLLFMIASSSLVSVGKQLGVSDNAVKKRLKRQGLT